MTIEKVPFRTYTEGGKPKYDSFTIWLNHDERLELDKCKVLLQQPKDSTSIKQLAHIGYLKLIGTDSTAWIMGLVSRNSYNNSRLGIPMESAKSYISDGENLKNLTDL